MKTKEDYYLTKNVDLTIDGDDFGQVSLSWDFDPQSSSHDVTFHVDIPKQKFDVSKHCSKLEDELESMKSDWADDPNDYASDGQFLKDMAELEKKIKFIRSTDCQIEVEEFKTEFERNGEDQSSKAPCFIPAQIEISKLEAKTALVTFQI